MLEEFELQRERLAIEAEIAGRDADDRRVPDIGPDQPLGGGDVLAVDHGRRGYRAHRSIIGPCHPGESRDPCLLRIAPSAAMTVSICRPVAERGRPRLKAAGITNLGYS
jgi:hypothetical protein